MDEQEKRDASPVLMPSLSFSEDEASACEQESPQRIFAAQTEDGNQEDVVGDDCDDDEFEFAFVLQDPGTGPPISADEIFANGQIRPVYPVFNRNLLLGYEVGGGDGAGEEKPASVRGQLRRLFIEERKPNSRSLSSSSSEADELEGIPADSYCVWVPKSVAPSPERCKKSSSAGSSRRWRLRDLVMGRSNSDGKEKFVFIEAEEKKAPPEKKGKEKEKGSQSGGGGVSSSLSSAAADKKGKAAKVMELDAITAHRIYNGKGGANGGARRSFLPYKQDLVGIFTNVNRLSRSHHRV